MPVTNGGGGSPPRADLPGCTRNAPIGGKLPIGASCVR